MLAMNSWKLQLKGPENKYFARFITNYIQNLYTKNYKIMKENVKV